MPYSNPHTTGQCFASLRRHELCQGYFNLPSCWMCSIWPGLATHQMYMTRNQIRVILYLNFYLLSDHMLFRSMDADIHLDMHHRFGYKDFHPSNVHRYQYSSHHMFHFGILGKKNRKQYILIRMHATIHQEKNIFIP